MKYIFYHVLIFISGSDEELLSKCSTKERIKYALYGVLILIPTISAFISMNYALSTFVENKTLVYLIALAWGGAILTIDRFIVSTFHKDESSIKNILSLKLWIRLIFAISLGVIISHPITMLFFDQSISKQIELEYHNEINESRKNRENDFLASPLQKQLDSLNAKIQCETELISAEYSGVRVQKCGIYSSGKFGCGNRCKIREKALQKLESRRETLERQITQEQINFHNLFISDSSSILLRKDYITRVNALEVLKEDFPHMANVELAILFFFILLDLIPLIFKFSGDRTEYDVLANERRSNMIASFKVENTNDIEVEKSLLDNLKDFKLRAIETIFEQEKSSNLKDIFTILKQRLGYIIDSASIGLETKSNPINIKPKKIPKSTKSKTIELLSEPAIFLLFVTMMSLAVMYFFHVKFSANFNFYIVLFPAALAWLGSTIIALSNLITKS